MNGQRSKKYSESGLLRGKVAIITGSTKGNGKAIAELFSQNGSDVVIVGRDEKSVSEVVEEIKQKMCSPLQACNSDKFLT